MTDMTHYRRVRWLVLAAMLTALPAAAQLVPNQLVVVDVTEAPPYWSQYVADVTEAYSDVQLAINDAVTYSRDAGEPYTVLVVARNNSLPWTGGVTMPADADVRILGSTRYSGSDVYEPVLDGNGLDVITISTTTANFINDTSKLYSPRIEGLHLVGGVNGIRIAGDYTSPYRPTINRCWMDAHPNHGVSIEGNNASALLINCSISDNAIDGVHIDTNPDSPGTFTDIIHCAIIGNGQHGVWVNRSWAVSSGTEPPKYARVRNSIVYKNATASSEPSGGGLVWSGGIAIIPEWDVITGGASAAIYGKNLSEAGADTRVYFGPRDIGADNPPVLFNPLSAPDRLEGLVPPSYNSAPGKVDVHIVRAFGTEDERTYTLQDAFTYVEDPAVEPQVTLVTPSHGPPEGGNWVLVEGVRFNVDGEVWWDFNSNGLIDGGMTRDLGPNGVVGPNTFAPYNPVPVWIPDQFRDNYLAQGGTRWLITSNTVDTLTLAGPTAALVDGAWSIVRPGDLRANERTWLSSALLHVEAPAAPGWYDPIFHNSAPMDVLVRNLYPSGAHTDSPAGDENMREYRYRGEDSTATVGSRPDIVQVMPNFYRRLNTDADPGQIFRIDILGWNLADGCTVRIGGEMCPYASVSTLVSGLPEGDWRKIIDVQVPLAEFGAGGSYDVEITNPNGLYDILPTGFTYFADSTPLLDNDPELPFLSTDEFEWSPSNFIDYNSGALINSAALTTRTLYGDSFDAGLRITFDDLGGNTYTIDDPLNNPGDAGADGVAMPNENVEQHVKHTQRFIEFALPARPDDITVANAFIDRTGGMPYVPAFNTAGLAVAIENVRSADLQDTYGPAPLNDYKRTSSRFFWINDPDVYFEVVGATLNCANNRAILTVVPSTSAGASSYIYSWAVNDFWVYVENKQIPEADITSIVPDPGGFGATFIEFSLDSLPAGLYGQRDVTVVLRSTSAFNPVNYALYSILKDGVYVPPDGSAWRLYARAVHPRTVPAAPLADEEFQVRVLGSGLAHKRVGGSNWPWTDVELRWPGNALSLRTVPAAECTVVSFFEAVFTVFDVASYGVPTSSPGNVNPVDVALVTYDGCTGLKLDEDVVVDGIIFWEFLPRIIKTNVSPRTVESGVAGAGAAGTFTVAGAGWEPGAYGGHYLLDSAFNAYMIQTNSDEMLTLYGGSPSSGAWRIVRGAYPIDSGLSGTWNAGTEQFTAVPDPGWGSLAGQYLIDASNNSFLIKDNTSNALTLHHVDAPPVNGGWRIAEPVHWGPVSGGDVLNIEGADFPIDEYPMARIGAVESMVTAYNSGYIRVKTPPAPFGLPATYDVSSVWTITAAGNTQPAPVEARAPEPERFTYIMDGPPKIVEIEPNQIYVNTSLMPGLMQDPEQFITITGYNFDDRVIVTFSFTDESSAVPTTMPVVLYHFSVSPNMIVIRAPDFMTLLDPLLHAEPDSTLDLLNNQTGAAEPDGYPDPTTAGNHYKVVVTVTNYVDDPGPPAPVGDSMLTSNPDNIFYVIDSEDMLEPSAADLLFNDVYLNYRDYVNVNPGTGSIAKDPMLLPEGAPASKPWWRGKLEVVGDGTLWGRNELNPVRDKAGKFIERPFTEADYELETRPDLGEPFNVQGTGEWPEPPPGEESQPRLPDIGADELMGGNPDIDMRYWYYAEVIPDPVPAMDAGELQVQIRVYGVIVPGSIYLVPQGVVFANGALDIPANRARCIEIQLQSYGEGVYFGTNAAPITTLIEDMDGSGGPSQGDYLADGHAAIVIPLGGGEYWGDDPVDLTDGGVIVEQAINGRHCLIDTIPPRPVLVLPTAPAQPSDIMTLNNAPGPYAAQGVALPDPTHPYSAVASATWRPWVEPSPSGGPFDGILPALPFAPPVPPVRDGVQAFFNPGSLSNSYPVEDLSITIGPGIAAGQYLAFLDTPPWYFDPGDLQRHVIQGNVTDTDYYTGAQTREVAGFPETVSGPVVVTDHTKPPTITVFSDSTYIPAIGEMVYTYEVSSALPAFLPSFVYAPFGGPFGNPGFDRDLPTQTVDYANDVVVSRWTFSDGGTPGLDYAKVSTGDAMHMGMRFAAVDLAGNVTRMTRNDGDALNTLHVWWMTRAETTLLPDIDGEEISVLPFYWYLDRPTTEDPEAQDIDAMPRFLWRLWYSDFIDGTYTPYTDWSTWTTDTQLADVAPGLAETLRAAGLAENWFLLVVVGVDEAGNYEVWPAGDLTLDASGLVTPTGSRDRRNWVRFYLGGGEIDTTLTHELWHNGDAPDAYQTLNKADGDVSFGPAAMVALHPDTPDPRVEGLFTIGVTLPPGLEGEDIAVQWSLQRDGGVLYQGVIPDPDPAGPWVYYTASGQTQTLQLPFDVDNALAFLDIIPEGQNSVTYVLTAQAFWDADGDDTWDAGERIDNTPASVQFKVVRDTSDTVGGYLQRERQRGKQQIILREE